MIKHKRQEERLCDPFELAVDLLQWDIVNLLIEYGYNLSQHEYLRDSVFLETIPGALKNDPSMFALLQETARTPRSLQKLVVLRVRDILKIDISNKVQSLSLPNSLRNDIIMVESSWLDSFLQTQRSIINLYMYQTNVGFLMMSKQP